MDLADHLRGQGYRVTGPRQAVWEVLSAAGGHLTAEEVHVRTENVNLASVYRALATLADVGLVRETNIGIDGAARWEPAHSDDQFHLVCTGCGSVEHHGGDLVARVRQHVSTGHGFEVESIDLSVTGLCGRCSASP